MAKKQKVNVQEIAIVRDHSASMGRLAETAREDFNELVKTLKGGAYKFKLNTRLTTVICGNNSQMPCKVELEGADIQNVNNLPSYSTSFGSTPLYDAVGLAIEKLAGTIDTSDKVYLVMVITDGQENSSQIWNADRLTRKINQLIKTGRWTFTFRVPNQSDKDNLVMIGVPRENILVWDTTPEGMRESSDQTQQALHEFTASNSRGITQSKSFYGKLDAKPAQVRQQLDAVTNKCKVWTVLKNAKNLEIKPFGEERLPRGQEWVKGASFYQLVKTVTVQAYKKFLVRNKKSGAIYSGYAARHMLGLPTTGTIQLKPAANADFDIFIQSTSVNRKLIVGTDVIYFLES